MDERAFRELHRQHWANMVRAAAQILPPDLAKDAVQDVMLQIWKRRDEWNVTVDSLPAYLHRAARNRALEVARREKLSEKFSSGNEDDQTSADPQDDLLNAELAGRMKEAIDELSPRSREAFLLSREQGMSQSEVARVMGISTETVKTQLKRATAALRRALRGYVDDQ